MNKEQLFKELKTLYNLWKKDYGDASVDDFYGDLGQSDFEYFLQKRGKLINANSEDMDDMFFWYNMMAENKEELEEGTLTVDSMKVPVKKTFGARIKRDETEYTTKYYEQEIDGYFMDSTQLETNLFYLISEGYIDDYGDLVDTDYHDSDVNDEDIDDVWEIGEVQQESIKNFVTNLSENETKFLIKKLLSNHRLGHPKSKSR